MSTYKPLPLADKDHPLPPPRRKAHPKGLTKSNKPWAYLRNSTVYSLYSKDSEFGHQLMEARPEMLKFSQKLIKISLVL